MYKNLQFYYRDEIKWLQQVLTDRDDLLKSAKHC